MYLHLHHKYMISILTSPVLFVLSAVTTSRASEAVQQVGAMHEAVEARLQLTHFTVDEFGDEGSNFDCTCTPCVRSSRLLGSSWTLTGPEVWPACLRWAWGRIDGRIVHRMVSSQADRQPGEGWLTLHSDVPECTLIYWTVHTHSSLLSGVKLPDLHKYPPANLHQIGLMGDVVLGFVLCGLFLISSLVILLRG